MVRICSVFDISDGGHRIGRVHSRVDDVAAIVAGYYMLTESKTIRLDKGVFSRMVEVKRESVDFIDEHVRRGLTSHFLRRYRGIAPAHSGLPLKLITKSI